MSPSNFKWLVHDLVNNGVSYDVAASISGHVFGSTPEWGKWGENVYGMDTAEGQAILGTPNGVSAAYLVGTWAEKLGWGKGNGRVEMATIYGNDERKLCFGWKVGSVEEDGGEEY